MTAMLTRMLAALAVVMGLGVLAAWAWDKSDTSHRAALASGGPAATSPFAARGAAHIAR